MQSDDNVCFELRALSHMIKRNLDGVLFRSNDEYRLTSVQGWVIKYLCDHESSDVFQRDLETAFSVRRSTMTSVLQLMEKNGLIKRLPVEYDARLKKLVLTPKAVDIHNYIENSHSALEKQMVKGISEAEQAEFLRIMRKLQANLSN